MTNSNDIHCPNNALFHIEDVELAGQSGNVLRDITISIYQKKLYLVAGPSGGGKTTLLKLLNGLIFPTSGCVCYRGKDIREYDLPELRSEVILMTQEPVLTQGTIRENIAAPFSFLSNCYKKMDEQRMADLLSVLGIGSNMLEREIEHLSGGEKQRVALVRALLPGPSVLLTDEPTSALDPLSEDKVIRMLKRLKESISLIVVSHSTRFLDMADEIVLISGGRITDRRSEIDEAEFREFLEREEGSGG